MFHNQSDPKNPLYPISEPSDENTEGEGIEEEEEEEENDTEED